MQSPLQTWLQPPSFTFEPPQPTSISAWLPPSLMSLQTHSLSARSLSHVAKMHLNQPEITGVFWMRLLSHHPAWLCLTPRDGAKTISRCLSSMAASKPGISGSQNIPCDIETCLGKGWGWVARGGRGRVQLCWVPCSPVAGALWDQECSSWAQWLSPA